jgi:hypothetical protein
VKHPDGLSWRPDGWIFVVWTVVKNFWTYITLFTLVFLRSLGGVIFIVVVLLCFTLCPFVIKWGVIFIFGPGMYFQTRQVIFVPEWPKGEFVRL